MGGKKKKIIRKRPALSPGRSRNSSNGSTEQPPRDANSPQEDTVTGGRQRNPIAREVGMLGKSRVVKAAAEMRRGFRRARLCWQFLTINGLKMHTVTPAREDPATELFYGKLLKLGSA